MGDRLDRGAGQAAGDPAPGLTVRTPRPFEASREHVRERLAGLDEATQRRAAIEAKLDGYRRLLEVEPSWQVLFVVPSSTRARWLRLVAGSVADEVATRTWVTTLPALRARQLDAGMISLDSSGRRTTARGLLAPADARDSTTPVGSDAWLRLLGKGGVEDVDAAIA